ncbi:hypothetical protein LguiB_000532 [Lonicera macranthoides]
MHNSSSNYLPTFPVDQEERKWDTIHTEHNNYYIQLGIPFCPYKIPETHFQLQ